MKLRKIVAALGVALPLAFAGMAAQAAVQVMSFQDDDIDFLLTPDGNGGLTPKLSGAFAVGDVLLSVFEMPEYSINGVNAIPNGMEVTGIAAIRIASITPGLPNGIGTIITFEAADLNYFNPGANYAPGAAVAMYMNSTSDFDLELSPTVNQTTNCVSRDQCVSEAVAGDLLQVDGFAGDLDEFWTAVVTAAGGNDPSVVGAVSPALGVAQFNAALTTFFNAPGPIAYQNIVTGLECAAGGLGLDGCIAGPTITGPILGGAGLGSGIAADGAFARSDIDAQKLLQVPEPGSLALVGLSLLGLAAVRRRAR